MNALAVEQLRTTTAATCLLCGQVKWADHLRSIHDYLTGESFDILKCESCGMIVTDPSPSEDEIGHYYPPRYRGNRHGFTGRMRVVLRRRAIESCFPKGFRGRILDIGCGNGAFVLEMLSRGWTVAATEIDPDIVTRMRTAGIDAKLPSDAERSGFDQPFDAVTCWHVMEHVEHPEQIAQWAKTQLKPSGVFQTTVPNIDCIQANLFGRWWLHLDVPRHRYHFTAQTFQKLLERAGYRIERRTNFALEYDWFGVIQSALNIVCTHQNVLFDMLTRPPADTAPKTSSSDKIISLALGPLVAAGSLLPLVAASILGDGATLTLTCKLH